MKEQTLGTMIAALRKGKGMTQLDLAQKLGVTDKAVSKWERDLSCPDVNSLPKLAEVLGVTVDELMQTKSKPAEEKRDWETVLDMVLKAVPLAMGLALIVVSILDKDIRIQDVAGFAGIGLFGITAYISSAKTRNRVQARELATGPQCVKKRIKRR